MQTQTESQQPDMFFHCNWFPAEIRLLQPPEDITTAEWAERHIYIVKSVKPGPWRNDNNPALAGIMNAADRKGIFRNMKFMVTIKGVQTGATTAAHIIVLRRMDGRAQNALVIMENEKKMRRIMKQRLLEMIKKSARLAAQMSDNPDDTTNYSITLKSGFCLNTGWAGSQAAVASDACETVILDEVDKYDTPINIEEAKDRITTYKETGLAVILSTPGLAGGPITVEMSHCDALMDYHVECPDCGNVQIMDFDHFCWPGKDEAHKAGAWKRLANRVQREKSVRYACGACGSLWGDYARYRAVSLGLKHYFHGWKMREEIDGPVSVGFHFPSWISPFKSLSDIAARWLRAQEPGQTGKLRMWQNNEAAEPFIEAAEVLSADILYARREVYAAEVPQGVLILTAAVDVQRNHIEVELKGWGPGEESWGIEHKVINGSFVEEKTQNALDDYLLKSWRHESGVLLAPVRVAIDSSDGHYTTPIYAFCKAREGRGVYAIKGSSNPRADVLDGRMVRRADAVFQKIGVTAGKDLLFGSLAITEPGPGHMHFPMSYDLEYFKQFTAERAAMTKSGRRIYTKLPGRKNEAIDLNNYNRAALRLYNPDWEDLRRRGIGGTESTRLVFKHHSRARHQDETITVNPALPVIVCCDFHKNPAVWVLCQTDGRAVWVIDEIVLRNASTTVMGIEVLKRYGSHKAGLILYGSAVGTTRTAAGMSEYAILRNLGISRQRVKSTNPPYSDRVNATNNMLEDVAGAARLKYHSRCIMLRKDFEQSLWLDDMSDIDRTDFGRGNATDALGYFVNYEWPLRAARPDPAKRFYK